MCLSQLRNDYVTIIGAIAVLEVHYLEALLIYVLAKHPYAHIRPVPQLQRFIEEKGADKVFACSVAEDYEEEGKRDFVVDGYGIAPEQVLFVRSKKEKVPALKGLASSLGLPEKRVALVDDAVETLDVVMEETDCTTVHVSSFFFC